MNKTANFWNKLANSYDNASTKSIQNHNKSVKAIQKHLNKDNVVIDYGCATGAISIDIAHSVKQVYGVDVSPKMIDIAKKKANERDLKNIEFIISSHFDNSFKKDSIDVIICFNVLHLVDDVQMVLKKVYELLKPQGIFISSTACVDEMPFLSSFFSFLGKLRILPKIRSFKVKELEDLISTNFKIIKSKSFSKKPSNFYCVAKKE